MVIEHAPTLGDKENKPKKDTSKHRNVRSLNLGIAVNGYHWFRPNNRKCTKVIDGSRKHDLNGRYISLLSDCWDSELRNTHPASKQHIC